MANATNIKTRTPATGPYMNDMFIFPGSVGAVVGKSAFKRKKIMLENIDRPIIFSMVGKRNKQTKTKTKKQASLLAMPRMMLNSRPR